MTYKTTEDHFKLFKEEVRKWVRVFGLQYDYEVYVYHENREKHCEGSMSANFEHRYSDIYLNSTWEVQPTEYKIKRTAFHEVCELVLYKLRDLGLARPSTEEQIIEEVHKIIRVLETAFWGEIPESPNEV